MVFLDEQFVSRASFISVWHRAIQDEVPFKRNAVNVWNPNSWYQKLFFSKSGKSQKNFKSCKSWTFEFEISPGRVGGWVNGWMEVKAILRIAYSITKVSENQVLRLDFRQCLKSRASANWTCCSCPKTRLVQISDTNCMHKLCVF